MSEAANRQEEPSPDLVYDLAYEVNKPTVIASLPSPEVLEQRREIFMNEDTRRRNEIITLYQRNSSEVMRINTLIERQYRFCVHWTEFCFATDIIFAITFLIYFLNPTDHQHDPVVFLGEILFLSNAFCFGYGLMAIHKKCPKKTNHYVKLLCIDLIVNLSLTVWLYLKKEQVGIIFSSFGTIAAFIALVTGRGMASKFKARQTLYLQLRSLAEADPLTTNL